MFDSPALDLTSLVPQSLLNLTVRDVVRERLLLVSGTRFLLLIAAVPQSTHLSFAAGYASVTESVLAGFFVCSSQ